MACALHHSLAVHGGGQQAEEHLLAVEAWVVELGLDVRPSLEETELQVFVAGEDSAIAELERRCEAEGISLIEVPEVNLYPF